MTAATSSDEAKLDIFRSVGLSEAKARETLKNGNLSRNLESVVVTARERGWETDGATGTLLYHIASKTKAQIFHLAPLLTEYVCTGRLDGELRLTAALDFLLAHPEPPVDRAALDAACGVGVHVTEEQVEQAVEIVIDKVKADLLSKRYRYPIGALIAAARKSLKWADGRAIKAEIDMQVLDLLGPKSAEDLSAPPKVEKKPKAAAAAAKKEVNGESAAAAAAANGKGGGDDEEGAATMAELMKKTQFHKPGENYKTDGYVITEKTMANLAAHLKRTGGRVRTRFPPEPNGLLHIGHAKAINVNFGYGAAHDGVTFLRYDDTNPEKEEEKFFTGIADVIEWLGYTPYKITHSSDYFQQLYEWAKVLIGKGLAYVCHQAVSEIRGFNPPASPWRGRPAAESARLFEDMKNGKFDEGEATLRLKTTLEEGKQDPVAYRIKFAPHHRTGEEWCIYPTYDYTHCLCDSIEDITHSLCTKEFQARRSSYYWLCNALDIYCPVQWEYGRLNVNYAVVSKRKIAKLIENGICSDWDDPRLFTLTALRRRGFPPEAINNFVAKLGLTGAQMVVDPSMLESVVRGLLNTSSARHMVVLDPLKVNVRNLPGVSIPVRVPDFPNDPERGHHDVTLSPTIYIERSDFRDDASVEKGYRRLTRAQPVGLRHAGFVITAVPKVVRDKSGRVTEIDAEVTPVDKVADKPKAFVQWVGGEPVAVEARLYDRLFVHKNPEDPAEVPGGFLSDVNPNSLVVAAALADESLAEAVAADGAAPKRFQFERNGFFAVDTDSRKDKLVFNRTVSLKEDAGKI